MGGIKDKIYDKSPVWLQNLAVSAFGYTWQKRRFGGGFESALKQVRQREDFSCQQWRDYQTKELRSLLLHAWGTVPFYRRKYSEAGFTVDQLAMFELEDLALLPMLEKNELRQFGTAQLLSSKREKGGEFFSSSGSTGTPTQILFSKPMHQKWSAIYEARVRNWAGVSRTDPRGMIGGRRVVRQGISKGPYYRYNIFEKQVYFSAYHISATTAEDYVRGMERYGVQYMTGYAMSNYFLARFIEEAGLKAPQLKAVISSSEKLSDEMRQTFSRVYGCKTYDSYSGVEACGLISENEYGQLLISPDSGIIEVLDAAGQPCHTGDAGEAVCTGLLNFDQPLIRYRIGDMLRLSKDQTCICGRDMPVVDEIVGRVEDTVIGSDGREMVRFHGIFIQLPAIIEGQIIQHTLTDFEIKVVAARPLTDKEGTLLIGRMQSQLGNIRLEINQVSHIPRNQNGKFQAVISKIKRRV